MGNPKKMFISELLQLQERDVASNSRFTHLNKKKKWVSGFRGFELLYILTFYKNLLIIAYLLKKI